MRVWVGYVINLAVDAIDTGSEQVDGGERSLAATVARALREEIVEGQIAPGERIKQDAVAQRLEVSRLPVREALRELSREGLVLLERDVGARVAPLELNNLLEIFLVRENVEPPLVAAATRKIGDEQLAEARELNERSERFANEEGAHEYVRIDRQFHDVIFAAAEMPNVHAIVRGHWNAAARYRNAYSHLPRRLQVSVVEHRQILEAIGRGAAEDAGELHRIHVRRTRVTLAQLPEIFGEGPVDG